MKNVMNTFKKYSLYLGMFTFAFGLNSCSDDDDGNIDTPEEEINASFEADAQVVSQNTIEITDIDLDRNAFLVVRKVNDDGTESNIIGVSDLLSENTTTTEIELDNSNATEVNLESGDNLMISLYKDDGDSMFDESMDMPWENADGEEIEDMIMVTSPEFSVTDQAVVDGTVSFDNISVTEDSFVAIHNQDETGEFNEDEVLGWTYVPANNSESVVVDLDDEFVPTAGDNLYYRLHMDDPADQNFTYADDPTQDVPARFGFTNDGAVTGSFALQ